MNKREAKKYVCRQLSLLLDTDLGSTWGEDMSDEDCDRIVAARDELAQELHNRGAPSRSAEYASDLERNNLPPAPGTILDVRFVMRDNDWYVKTRKGWYYLIRGEWMFCPMGPL